MARAETTNIVVRFAPTDHLRVKAGAERVGKSLNAFIVDGSISAAETDPNELRVLLDPNLLDWLERRAEIRGEPLVDTVRWALNAVKAGHEKTGK